MPSIKERYKKQTSTPKGKIILLSLVLIIITAVAGGILYWNAYKKQIIRAELEKALRKGNGLYKIAYDDLKLDEVNGNLSVINLRIDYDSTKLEEMRAAGKMPSMLMHIQVPSLHVTGVKTPRALLNKEISGNKVTISNPLIELKYTMEGDTSRNVPDKAVYEQILGGLNMIHMDTVEITGGIISTQNLKTKRKNIELIDTRLVLADVAVDSASNADTTRLFFARTLHLQCGNISWYSGNGLYRYTADSITVASDNSMAYVKRFAIEPQKGEDAFVKSLPTQDDRFDFNIRGIAIKGLKMLDLLNESFYADSITIDAAQFKIYRDLSIPRDKKNRVGTYPHQAVGKLPIPVEVPVMIVNNTYVEYKEKNVKTQQSGKVRFHNSTAVIRNLTNKKEKVAQNNVMTVDISTRFLDITPFNVKWKFYLLQPNGRFDVSGTLGAMDAKAVNVLAEPMGPARIEGGRINKLQFNLSGNDYTMSGKVLMLYDDLKVAVLEKDEDSKKLEKKKLISFVANILAKNSNPKRKGQEPREIDVKNERNTNRSIFNLAWKTLFEGIKETVGINKKSKEK